MPVDDAALTKAYLQNRTALMSIQRLIGEAEARRDAALENYDRYLSTWADPAIRHGIVEAEFQEVSSDDLLKKGGRQSPQRAIQHRTNNPRRKAAGEPQRNKARARGSS